MPNTIVVIGAKSPKRLDGTHMVTLGASMQFSQEVGRDLRLRLVAAKYLILLAARLLGCTYDVDVHEEQEP